MRKGIDRNKSPEATGPEFISWGKNCLISEKFDAFINEKGNKIDIDMSLLNISNIVGEYSIGNIIIFCYINNSNRTCIATIDEDTKIVTERVNRNDLGFTITHPVDITGKYDAQQNLKVILTDGVTSVKYINLTTASPSDNINLYNLFPVAVAPNIILQLLENGGSVLTGAYFVAIQYLTSTRSRSQYSQLSPPIYINNFSSNAPPAGNSGDLGGVTSGKAIKINLTQVDTTYSKIVVSIISNIQGVTKAFIAKEVSITGTSFSTVFDGTEFLSDITIEEIITKDPIYNTAKIVQNLNDELLLADLTTEQTVDCQVAANQLKIEWVSTVPSNNLLYDNAAYKSGNQKTFMHDEVYAFYVRWEIYRTGQFTQWFHIPGPIVAGGIGTELGISANSVSYSGGIQVGGASPLVYEVEDTSSGHFTNLNASQWKGDMGYWQNNNELYPANFPDTPTNLTIHGHPNTPWVNAGTPVRHHKFPSIAKLSGIIYTDAGYGSKYLDYLGIYIQSLTNPNSIDGGVRGIQIGYAKRSLGEQSVLGQTIIQFASNTAADVNKLGNNGGNWIKENQTGTSEEWLPNKFYIRMNAFDTLLDKPSIADLYVANQLKFRANLLDTTTTAALYGLICNAVSLNNSEVYTVASNFTFSAPGTTVVKSPVSSIDLLRKLSIAKYVPANVLYSIGGITIDNQLGEDTIFAKVDTGLLNLDTTGIHIGHDGTASTGLFEETYLALIKAPRSDFFLGYRNQEIVNTSFIARDFINPLILSNAGDCFIGTHFYTSLSRRVGVTTDPTKGSRMFKMFLCECWNNPNMRMQTDGDYSTYYYPAFTQIPPSNTNLQLWTSLWDMNKAWNQLKYSKSFSAVDDMEASDVFNPDIPDIYQFPFRIAKSENTNKDTSLSDGWNVFKAASYYETVRNKGRIINLENWANDNLLIHHERALFVTRDTGILQTGSLPITLGSADLFEIRPREQASTAYGIGGTQHRYGCLLCDLGYVYVDVSRGQVLLYDGETSRDLTKGLRLFFRDYLNASQDNPFNGQGISIAFDKDNNRILLSQKAGYNFTVSYDLIKDEWAMSHDYLPDYIFNTRRKVYTLKNNKLYTQNVGDRGNFFGTLYPSYVDFIVNDKSGIQKVLSSIQFLTKYFNDDGSVNQRKTITSITIWNDQHCTGKIPVTTNETGSLYIDGVNAKVVDETWSFDQIFNLVTDSNVKFISDIFSDFRPVFSNLDANPVWYQAEPLRGKFFIVRLEIDNTENKEVHIRELIPELRESKNGN